VATLHSHAGFLLLTGGVNTPYIISPQQGLQNVLGASVNVTYMQGNNPQVITALAPAIEDISVIRFCEAAIT
jgi:hypothetical protein